MKRARLICCVVVLAVGGCVASPKPAIGDARLIYYVVYNFHHYSVGSILVNGIPAIEKSEADPYYTGYQGINWFLKDGVNDIHIHAERTREPNFITIEIYATVEGQQFNKGTLLYSWTPKSPGAVVDGKVTITAAIPRKWAWQTADEVTTLSNEDRRAILGLIEKLWKAYASKNASAVIACEGNDKETVVALYSDYAQERQHEDEAVRQVLTGPCHISPLDLEKISLVSYGRLVIATYAEGRELIYATSDAEGDPEHPLAGVGPTRLMFMRQAGKWVITGYGL